MISIIEKLTNEAKIRQVGKGSIMGILCLNNGSNGSCINYDWPYKSISIKLTIDKYKEV